MITSYRLLVSERPMPRLQVNRRDLIGLIGCALAGPFRPMGASAQQAMPTIGVLHQSDPRAITSLLAAFHQGLGEMGFFEGRNIVIEYRWGEGRYDRMPEFAADLVRRQPAVLFTGGPWNVRTLKELTKSIPIVFTMGDPVKEGVVASMNRPGGNVTGHSFFANLLIGKCLGLLREIVPKGPLAILVDPENPNAEPDTQAALMAAPSLGRPVFALKASTDESLDAAFAAMAQANVGAAYVNIDAFFLSRRDRLVANAARYTIPAMYERQEFVEVGGLMSYGASQADSWREGARYVGRILKGEKPGDLPVQQSSKFDLVLNLKTAKTLGLEFPPGVLAIADEVIE